MVSPLLRWMASLLGVALIAHAVVYWTRAMRARAADAARLPPGPDGIIPGAQSITLHASTTHAVLLIHGFGDTPQTVRWLSEYLHREHGWSTHAPLLPGHGRTLAEFDRSGATVWRTAVHAEYLALKARYETVVLVGLSMGGALATMEAADDGSLKALVLLAPYLTPPASAQRLAPLANVISLMIPYLKGGDRERSIFDPAARALALGYGAAPPKRVRDLVSVAHDARFAAASVLAPTLLMHSRSDYRIPVPLAEAHPALFTQAVVREQEWVEGCGHVITVDYCREQVWASTARWLARFAGSPRDASAQVS
ncbi:MAG: alpha/beta fold hydrolase [Gemmatimonadaceae bacterium]|nr:alpha/beta fold hydrolase [Gemmatimonadaceae bacterium]